MARGLVKICGLSTAHSVNAAITAGADMIGLVFFPKSPRHVTLEQAAALADLARGQTEIVALTVNADDATLDAIMRIVRPDWLQLHGAENIARIHEIRTAYKVRIMKAVALAEAADLPDALAFAPHVDRLLFDAKPPKTPDALPGGNGLSFDWRLLHGVRVGVGLDLDEPYMLSGGLTPDNAGEAIALTRCGGVDVSSGVESAPGVKDPELIRAFVQAAKAAYAALD